jgi:transposase
LEVAVLAAILKEFKAIQAHLFPNKSSGATPQKIAQRARIILRAADGQANLAIARGLGISRPTVLLWRKRFAAEGVRGIMHDATRPGRRKAISPEKV